MFNGHSEYTQTSIASHALLQLLRGRVVPMFDFMDSELSPEYISALRRLSGAQKLRVASGLYWTARKVKAARVRQQHPEWSEDQVALKVKEIFTHAVT